MSSNVIDYFAVVGRADESLNYKNICIDNEDPKNEYNPSDLWASAITDIALIFADKGEILPDDEWEIIHDTISGYPANLNSGDLARGLAHIAIKRRAQTKRLDHITEISLIHRDDPLPDGFEIISASISNMFPADINTMSDPSVFIVKRSPYGFREYFKGTSFIDDICIVIENNGEEIPGDYVAIEKPANKGPPYGDIVRVAYRLCVPLGICDLKYESATLDRYPLIDLPNVQLPSKELPLFVFPRDLGLKTAPLDSYPLPDFFSMVFTGAKGDYLYCACLQFFELVDNTTLENCCKKIYGTDSDFNLSELSLNFNIYCPKVICVISSNPFYRAMRRYLRQIYSLSISTLDCPLEFFISSVVAQIPMPIEGGRPFYLQLDAALIASSSRAMAPIRFEVPPVRFFPHMDLDFAGPLRCLSVDKLLALFSLMLQEAKILFTCHSNALLTEVMETLRSLLFPLQWSSCFVSRLPDSLCGLLQALGGFMIGVHISNESHDKIDTLVGQVSTAERKKQMQNFFNASKFKQSLQSGTYIVDLSDNEIYVHNGISCELLNTTKLNSLVKAFPANARKRLANKLQSIATAYKIGPQLTGLEVFDSAFEFQVVDESSISSRKWAKFPTLEIRDAFMVFMIDLLGDIPKYIIPPVQDLSADVYRTFKEQFATSDYLSDSDRTTRPILEALLETQMFAVLLQQRAELSQYSLVFFENAASLLREMGLSAGGHGRPQGIWTQSKGVDLPICLYKLLGQKRYASLFEIPNQDSSEVHYFKNKPGGPLERAIARLEALESFRKSDEDDDDEDYEEEDDDDYVEVADELGRASVITPEEERQRDNTELRNEIDRSEDLHLYDYDYGPLILPGPTTALDLGSFSSEASEAKSIQRRGSAVVFSYEKGWPKLDEKLLKSSEKAIHEKLSIIREARIFSMEKIDHQVRMLTRSPSERLSYRISGRLLKEINGITTKESKAALGLVSDIVNLSINMLNLRILGKCKPVKDILQILGILAQYESFGLLQLIDECVWRGILLSCEKCGGDFMRAVGFLIYELMKINAISPDALTYGQYIRAIASLKSNVTSMEGAEIVDPYIHLEELGLVWLIHKSYEIQQSKSSKSISSNDNRSVYLPLTQKSPTKKSTSVFDYFRSRSAPTESNNLSNPTVSHSSKLSSLVSSKLNLSKLSGYYSLDFPQDVSLPLTPRFVKNLPCKLTQNNNNNISLFEKFEKINLNVYNDYYSDISVDLPSDFSPFRQNSLDENYKSVFESPVLVQDNNANNNRVSRTLSLDSSKPKLSIVNSSENTKKKWSIFRKKSIQTSNTTLNKSIDFSDQAPQEMNEIKTKSFSTDLSDSTDFRDSDSEESESPDVKDKSMFATPPASPPQSETPVSKNTMYTRNIMTELHEIIKESVKIDNCAVGIHSRTPCSCGYAFLDEEILAQWSGSLGTNTRLSIPNLEKVGDTDLDIINAHRIFCPVCRTSFTPYLHVKCYGLVDKMLVPTDKTPNNKDNLRMLWDEKVAYLSPFGLRFGIEEVVHQIGEKTVNSIWLYEKRPDLYWNAVWYCTRIGVPSGFLPLESKGDGPFDGVVFTGWREHIVRLKVCNYLNGFFKKEIRLHDIFAGCSSEDIDALQEVQDSIQSKSVESIKNAMLKIAALPKVLDACSGGNITHRNIYITLLTISYDFQTSNSTHQQNLGQSQIVMATPFDQIFNELFESNLTDSDFQNFQDLKHFKSLCSNTATIAIRYAFGFLI